MRALSFATIFSAISGFAVIMLSPQALSPAANEAFIAYWSLFFALTGVLTGILQETTRAVSTAQTTPERIPPHPASPLRFALIVGVIIALGVGISAPWWIPQLLPSEHLTATTLLSVAVLLYAIQSAVGGALSGAGLWSRYALMLTIDAGLRLLVAGIAWATGAGLIAFLIATVIGTLSWAIISLLDPRVRAACGLATDLDAAAFRRTALKAMAAGATTAVLITGFPALLKLLTGPGEEGSGPTLLALAYAVTLTRAPLLVPLMSFQSALVVHFVKAKDRILRALATIGGAVILIGLVGAVLAWLIGPWLIDVLLRQPEYAVPGMILAGLTFGATMTALLMVSGTATIAARAHRAYTGGWLAATLVVIGALFLPVVLSTQILIALIAGPLIGICVHAMALRQVANTQTLLDTSDAPPAQT